MCEMEPAFIRLAVVELYHALLIAAQGPQLVFVNLSTSDFLSYALSWVRKPNTSKSNNIFFILTSYLLNGFISELMTNVNNLLIKFTDFHPIQVME